jgi:RNA polymerase sigma factor (sigma-70 family)
MNDDVELLRIYADHRSEAEFAQLVNRHIGLVYATALRRVGGDTHLAEDVTQAVFTDLARKANSLRGHSSLAGWLYLATQMSAASVVRRERRRKDREAAALAMNLSDHAETSSPDASGLRPVLDDAIVELKADDREAILLRFFQGQSFSEIGATLRVTEEAARKRVDRALEKLHRVLVRRGITSTATALGAALTTAGASTVPTGLAAEVSYAALAQAATGASLGASIVSTVFPAAAVLAVGAAVIFPQFRENQNAAAELAHLTMSPAAIEQLQTENHRLAQAIAATREAEQVQAVLPRLRTQLASLPAIVPAPTTKNVVITTQGTISWEGEPITLDEFLIRLATLKKSAAGDESLLRLTANGANFYQMLYGLDEARKAGIKHIIIESDVIPDPKSQVSWF